MTRLRQAQLHEQEECEAAPAECPACVASRSRVVDAFFLGYKQGFREAVLCATGEEAKKVKDFCLAHERMLVESFLEILREKREP